MFLQGLLEIFGTSFRPGTTFEQNPVRLPARGTNATQGSLFLDAAPTYTTERAEARPGAALPARAASPAEG